MFHDIHHLVNIRLYCAELYKESLKDFEEIMTYQNYISSNSTYSWWSIFLNQNKILKVTTPKKWMNQPYEIYRPSTWKIISN